MQTDYFHKYNTELQKGHSEEWAKIYAESIEDHSHAFNDSYLFIKKGDPAKALKELKIHCKAMGGDEFYTKHFITLMEKGEALSDPDKQAALYSRIYKEEVEKGKSELFADTYSDLVACEEYTEVYCFAKATEYEKTIGAGQSKEYADAYASRIANYIANQYSNYKEATDHILYSMEKQKIEEQLIHLK